MAVAEIKKVTGVGVSPDESLSKRIAEDSYKAELESYGVVNWNDLVIKSENLSQQGSNYRYEITVEVTVTPPDPPPTNIEASASFPADTNIEEELKIVENGLFLAPEVEPTIVATPQKTTEQTKQQTEKKEEQQQVTDATKVKPELTINQTPPNLKAQGQEKLAEVLNKKRSEIKRFAIPLIISLATALGIKFLLDNLKNPEVPETCPPRSELSKLIKKRNEIVKWLNDVARIIDTLSKVLIGVGIALAVVTILVKTVQTVRKVLAVATKAVPAPPGIPGAVTSGINNLKDSEEKAIERLFKITAAVLGIGLALSLINAILLKVIALLKPIDDKLIQCSQNQTGTGSSLGDGSSGVGGAGLIPLSPILLQLEQINNAAQQVNDEGGYTESYEGFILEIVEEQYTPTVIRRKGVAKNSQDIVLLETPPSFTTNNEILINQLKLIISTNNLKAY